VSGFLFFSLKPKEKTMRLSICDVVVAPNRRSVDEVKVRELADSIREVGLLNPITVTPDKHLVAGAHRLEACRSLGWTEIECTVLDGSALLLQLAEIDENLIRSELDPISVGELAIKRDEILEALGLRATSGTNLKNSRTGADSAPVKTTADIAKEVGRPPYRCAKMRTDSQVSRTDEALKQAQKLRLFAHAESARLKVQSLEF